MPEAEILRVLYLGSQPPLRSQTLWHAIAHGVSAGEPATLSFVRPAAPYVSIGYHRRLDEVDLEECDRRGLPVFRRMIGGGPVYLDSDQLFFQITVPRMSTTGAHAMRTLLAPAAEAFRDVGIDAEVDGHGDISVGEAKVSGVGGGQIADAAVAVGNLLESFDHDAAAAVLRFDDPTARDETLRLMRRFVLPTPADPEAFMAACVRRYADALELVPRPGTLSPAEERIAADLDERFVEPTWLRGPDRPEPAVRQAKIRAGVWVFISVVDGTRVVGSVVGDRLDKVSVADPTANGDAADIELAIGRKRFADAPDIVRPLGPLGARVAEALTRCDGRTL